MCVVHDSTDWVNEVFSKNESEIQETRTTLSICHVKK